MLNSAWDMIDYLSTKTNFILKISSNYPFLNSNNDIYLFFFFFSLFFLSKVILVTKSLDVYPLTSATIMVQIASHILAYTNSCVNPILYAFLSDSFRKAFRKIIYCRPRSEQNRQLGPLTKTTRAASTGDII